MEREHIELENSASGIVASGNVTVNCRNIILYHNSKPKGKNVEPTKTRSEPNQDTTGSNKICNVCNEPIMGYVIEAMGKMWHEEHFVCFHCKKQLHTVTTLGATQYNYYPVQGKPYCIQDFGKLFCPICAACKEPITKEAYTAMGRDWHTKHFVCTYCKKELAGTEHFIQNDQPYCEKDFYNLFGQKCAGCENTIVGSGITAMDKEWHKDCFVCSVCKSPIKDGFWKYQNRPYCQFHYNQIKG